MRGRLPYRQTATSDRLQGIWILVPTPTKSSTIHRLRIHRAEAEAIFPARDRRIETCAGFVSRRDRSRGSLRLILTFATVQFCDGSAGNQQNYPERCVFHVSKQAFGDCGLLIRDSALGGENASLLSH